MTRRHSVALSLLFLGVFLSAALASGVVASKDLVDTGGDTPSIHEADACRIVEAGIALPGSLEESSGIAVGIRDPHIFWSHNDRGNNPSIIGFDRTGARVAEFTLRARNRDWEDIDVGPCDLGSCLYISDTGDNNERRDNLRVLRMGEPARDVTQINPTRFDIVLPNGPRDIESMYVLPGERLYFVTKGRNHPIVIYQYPGPLRDEEVVLREVQTLGPAANPLEWVTGAAASRDGRFVAIRSYATLYLYRVASSGHLELLPDGEVSLLPVREAQGEGVAFGPDGLIYLTSERRNAASPMMNVMECELG